MRAKTSTRLLVLTSFQTLLISVLGCMALAETDQPVTSVWLESEDDGSDLVITFALPFPRGEVRDGVIVRAGDRLVEAQVDVKRRHDDGSVKHAVLSAFIQKTIATEPIRLSVYPGESPAAGSRRLNVEPPEGFAAEVIFRFPDGTTRKADCRVWKPGSPRTRPGRSARRGEDRSTPVRPGRGASWARATD